MVTRVTARDFTGKEVIGTRGWKIGTVSDVVIDTGTWAVQALEVTLTPKVAREFGLKQTLRSTRLPVRVQDIQGIGDAAIVLKITKEQLRELLRTTLGSKKTGAAKEETAPGTSKIGEA